jgi:apolipoprotein D and lipocalin family protein
MMKAMLSILVAVQLLSVQAAALGSGADQAGKTAGRGAQPDVGGIVKGRPLRTVDYVDLKRYMGRWYEIARYPNPFQRGLVAVIVDYRLREDGRFDVVNTGRKNSLRGEVKRSTAVGWVNDQKTYSKLWVRFFWPTKAPYWIIDLGQDYEYAVVGQPSRKYLWIISRTPQMDEGVYRGICDRLRQQGYDPARLKRTLQPAPAKTQGP